MSTVAIDSQIAPSHEVVVASTPAERQQCLDIRVEVFHREQKFPLETEIDKLGLCPLVTIIFYEDISTHILLRLTPSLTPIGTIRGFKVPDKNYYKLTRLAVLKDYRKYRFGRELVHALHEWVVRDAREQIAKKDPETLRTVPTPTMVEVIAHSQLYVKAFYVKFGYEPEGDEFDEDGDPHQKMVLQLPL